MEKIQFENIFYSIRSMGKNINDINEIILYCNENGIELKYEDLLNYVTKSNYYNCEIIPKIIVEFIKKFVVRIKPQNVLNPCDRYGEVLYEISRDNDNCHIVGVFNGENSKILKKYFNDNVEMKEDVSEIDKNRKYDLIFWATQLGRKISRAIEGINFREYSLSLIHDMKDFLSDNGYMICVVADNIVISEKNNKTFDYLRKNGIFVNGIIDLPEGVYTPSTNIATKILIISKKDNKKRFIAKLDDVNDVDSIVKSFTTKKTARNYTNGMFVDCKIYPCMSEFLKEKEFKNILKKFTGRKYILKEVEKSINLSENKFKSEENCIYIPKVGCGDVVLLKDDFNIKSHNYIQLVLDKEVILASYACFFFNAPGGKKIREQSSIGYIKHLNKVIIEKLPIVIPSIDEQIEIIEVARKIHELENKVYAVKNKFLSNPAIYADINRSIDNINNEETLEDWVETLPFPLASILRRYVVAQESKDKQEILFYFFEAYALFNSTILLSILRNYKEQLPVNDILKGCELKYFVRGTFGSWVTLLNSICTYFNNEFLKKSEKEEQIKYYFKTNDIHVIKVLCSKEGVNILNKAKSYRNDWKGHGGICSEKIYNEHDIILSELLNELRKIIGNVFKNVRLVRSINIKSCVKNNYINNIQVLMGSNSQFKRDSLETEGYGMDNTLIYLFMNDTRKIMQLIPIMIFKSSPENVKNACYFYSKTEKEETEYVSYHYDDKPEDIEQGTELFSCLEEIFE